MRIEILTQLYKTREREREKVTKVYIYSLREYLAVLVPRKNKKRIILSDISYQDLNKYLH